MARNKVIGYRDDATTGSVPAGDGGRVRRPIHLGPDGIPTLIDPHPDLIYSGMTKRHAINTGRFCDLANYRDED